MHDDVPDNVGARMTQENGDARAAIQDAPHVLTLDLDVELAVLGGAASRQARDNLALLLETVADFGSTDAQPGLTGLLAYLRAEEANGINHGVAGPGWVDEGKAFTVHLPTDTMLFA